MKKKVLIIYAPYGTGHKTVANNIAEYFKDQNNFQIKVLDVAKFANLLGKASIKGFSYIMNHRKKTLFNFIYEMADNKVGSFNQEALVKKSFDNPKIREEIIGFAPDITISTHFFGGNIINYYNKLGLINSKIITVITDYATHSYWQKYHERQDAFIVANLIVKNAMIKKGILDSKIYAFGLPFNRKESENLVAPHELFFNYNLDINKKTYLFFGGTTAGSTKNFNYLKALIKRKYPINIIFVSGKNKKLEYKCRNYVIKNEIKNVKVLGFVKVYDLLNISDVVITKPGGATITECMDMKVPMILIPGNGGPEKYNARFICKKKFGVNTKSSIGLCHNVGKTVKNEKIIKNWKDNLNKEEKEDSLEKIYELCVNLLK